MNSLSPLHFLADQINIHAQKTALIWQDQTYSYNWLKQAIQDWGHNLKQQQITQGKLVVLLADYSPNSIALLLALFNLNCIVIPLAPHMQAQLAECLQLTQAEFLISVDTQDTVKIIPQTALPQHGYWKELRHRQHPGVVLFSSGSTGKSKAVVHDVILLLEKHTSLKKQTCVVGFLLFDHIGGLNTLFYTLFNGGCFIALYKRDVKTVCEVIEKHQAHALTTTPTFLTLLMVSGIHTQFDLKSLQIINYGTERMPESTLEQLKKAFPQVRLAQAYGLSEVGVLPIRSENSDSLWFTLDPALCPYRIVEGLLEIKTTTSMMGYLNAANPFTEDGWFKTGDAVEVDGNRLRILGRRSEMINVGGEKVYPTEIEGVIQTMAEVAEVAIGSRASALIGQMIIAKIRLKSAIPEDEFKIRLFDFCKSRLANYKIPRKILLTDKPIHSERFKKTRNLETL